MSLSFILLLCCLHMLLGLFFAIDMLFFCVVPACHALLLHYLFLLLRLFPLCISSLPLLVVALLENLLPGDTGRDYPQSANVHAAIAAHSDVSTSTFPSGCAARPYMWAQWLAGIPCLPAQATDRLESSTRNIIQQVGR